MNAVNMKTPAIDRRDPPSVGRAKPGPSDAGARHARYEILIRYCSKLAPMRCAVVYPTDRASLAGVSEAVKQRLIEPILIGPEGKIRAIADAEGIDLADHVILPAESAQDAARRAVELVWCGQAEALMKDTARSAGLMMAVADPVHGLRTGRRLSHSYVMDIPAYPRPLFLTDAVINVVPTLEDKRDIIQNVIDLARMLGLAEPKVAILSAADTIDPRISSTLDAAVLCKMADRGQIRSGVLDGPLTVDNALSPIAATAKNIASPVAGCADVLVVPDLEAGNMLAKQLFCFAEAGRAGIVLGAQVPVILTNPTDTVHTRLASAAIALRVVRAKQDSAATLET